MLRVVILLLTAIVGIAAVVTLFISHWSLSVSVFALRPY
jgi:hypothetical protein